MSTIIAIPGSLRSNSYNLKLLRAARELAPEGVSIEIEQLNQIPLYDGDVEESEGVPEPVARLKDLIAAADGLIISSPEYNRGVPGVAKNAIDWLSRPADDRDRIFAGLPGAVISSAGGSGGRVAQEGWLTTFHYLKMHTFSARSLYITGGWNHFDGDEMTDDDIRERLGKLIAEFADFCAAHLRG